MPIDHRPTLNFHPQHQTPLLRSVSPHGFRGRPKVFVCPGVLLPFFLSSISSSCFNRLHGRRRQPPGLYHSNSRTRTRYGWCDARRLKRRGCEPPRQRQEADLGGGVHRFLHRGCLGFRQLRHIQGKWSTEQETCTCAHPLVRGRMHRLSKRKPTVLRVSKEAGNPSSKHTAVSLRAMCHIFGLFAIVGPVYIVPIRKCI